MKINFIVLCLMVGGGLAPAAVQTGSIPDKPVRLSVASYGETASLHTTYDYLVNYLSGGGYTGGIDWHEAASLTWVDGAGGTNWNPGNYVQYSTLNPAVTGNATFNFSWSWPASAWPVLSNGIGVMNETWDSTNSAPYSDSATNDNFPAPVVLESCAVNNNIDLAWQQDFWNGTASTSGNMNYQRKANATMRFETGGPAGSS